MHADERRIYIALLTAGFFVIVMVVFFIITILRYQRRKVTAYRFTLQEEMRIQETERKRMASDLHDDFGASLSVIKLKLSLLCPDDPEQAKILHDTGNCIDELSDKVRVLSNRLMPVVLERHGLKKAIEELISDLIESGQYQVDYQLSLPLVPIGQEAAIHIYRIFQEIINNAVKHSHATSFNFRVFEQNRILYIRTEDNGTGFDPTSLQTQKGLGLQNIRMRADILQAKLYVTTRKGAGVRYEIEIPEHSLLNKALP